MIANCADCQSVRAEPTKMNLHCWETPSEPFQRVHVDFAGPFMETYFFIYVDAFSKWPEIKICRSITAEGTVAMCRKLFSTFGIPSVLVSDHGVQFTSEVFQQFLKMNRVVHKMGAPYHPATNGQAERYVQTFKQKLKALKCSKSQLNLELSNILLTYRKMIHPSTGKSPSMLVFGRQIRSRLDLLLPKNETSNKADMCASSRMVTVYMCEIFYPKTNGCLERSPRSLGSCDILCVSTMDASGSVILTI
ncbi:uncharacterized protein K02A2.6-like [Toxorhynchites rutilus septentrionalis]|uniref:uncharacterized protein K02A2.6-like n=1 Tax=Toxorhynchites rutilus septentrionalis TaxID=329112 RepID=UPI0024784DC4|nr:uncharacterized protein K02A2.6-like [Toxorhynchites rutilus septentrionalis]